MGKIGNKCIRSNFNDIVFSQHYNANKLKKLSLSMRWQPSVSIENLKKRGKILSHIRQFFADRNVLEVQTPLIAHVPVTDPYLNALKTEVNSKTGYLQTSPEYAMKRLLATGSGDIYQICKAFRDDEQGKLHNPEFTLLEWYRIGFDDQQLMQELSDLCQIVLSCQPAEMLSYQHIFKTQLNINPHNVELDVLHTLVQKHCGVIQGLSEIDKTTALQLLLSEVVEFKLGWECPVIIYDYPKEQAALARLKGEVAARFELYVKGIELANGYWELTDSNIQRQRFQQDIVTRKLHNLPIVPIDDKLLAAMEQGLPDCAGVALGLDRLIMLALDEVDIQNVMMV